MKALVSISVAGLMVYLLYALYMISYTGANPFQ